MPIADTRKPTKYGQLFPPFPAGDVVVAAVVVVSFLCTVASSFLLSEG